VGLTGCGDFVPPVKVGGETSAKPAKVDKEKFGPAWEKLKDILVATAVATTLTDCRSRVRDLRSELDAIDEGSLNEDEKRIRAKFFEVYWAYEDSLSLWTADLEASDKGYDGIPVYRNDEPLLPRADEILGLYGLVVKSSQSSDRVEYVPEDSVGKLWEVATRETEKWLLPAMNP
jgi:hypothetical protein